MATVVFSGTFGHTDDKTEPGSIDVPGEVIARAARAEVIVGMGDGEFEIEIDLDALIREALMPEWELTAGALPTEMKVVVPQGVMYFSHDASRQGPGE